jgi:Skp family chaperone for outer membrane proteins
MNKMKKFFITNKQREQAERMVAKWEARAEAYWKGETEGYGVGVVGYCKNDEQALEAESQKSMKGLAEKTQKANTEIRKVLKEYIEKNKDKYGCNYVLGYQTEGAIFYVDPKFDITQQVLEDLNK